MQVCIRTSKPGSNLSPSCRRIYACVCVCVYVCVRLFHVVRTHIVRIPASRNSGASLCIRDRGFQGRPQVARCKLSMQVLHTSNLCKPTTQLTPTNRVVNSNHARTPSSRSSPRAAAWSPSPAACWRPALILRWLPERGRGKRLICRRSATHNIHFVMCCLSAHLLQHDLSSVMTLLVLTPSGSCQILWLGRVRKRS